jgi:LuxR family maltose regulon positive regulatory protein
MTGQILSTKLSLPPLRTRLVNRGRLFQRLDQGVNCGFVLVSAPAGYGKSTLLSSWLRQARVPAAWFSLDDGDNDPLRFLNHLAAVLAEIEPSVGEALANSLRAAPLPAVEILLTPLVNQLSQVETPFWLVLDDYHIIQSRIVHEAVGFLLEHRPTLFCLIIATRADPPFPLSRMRARSQIAEFRLADLRFSDQETEEFLTQVIGLDLSDDDLALLQASTEGWIAGLQMAGLSLQGRKDASVFIRSFSGEHRYILDFLFEEVFQRQTEEIQSFLLQTAILERLCAPLCDQVARRENSQEVLETLGRSNLFLIALDEERHWFRYHHLFRDLLKYRLNRTNPEEMVSLHQRASAWFAGAHDLQNAIAHALAALDFERAAGYIEQILQSLDRQNQQMILTSWISQLPQGIMEDRPWLCVYRAWGEYWTGQRGMEEKWLQMAEKAIDGKGKASDAERRRIQGHIAAVRAHIAIVAEDIPRILDMAENALDLLPDHDAMRCETAIALGAAYWALGNASQSEQAFRMAKTAPLEAGYPTMVVGPTTYAGIQQVKQGRLRDALVTFQDGLRLATLPDGKETPIAGFPNIRLGDVWREWNDLALAAQYLVRGVRQCVQFGQPDVLSDAYVCLARYQLAAGDLEGVQDTLLKADWLSQRAKVDPFVFCWLDDCRVRAWLAEGDTDAASGWAKSSGLSIDGAFSYLHDLAHQNLARVLVAQGLLDRSKTAQEEASRLLVRLRIAARQAGWVHDEIRILVLQAVNECAFGQEIIALKYLAQAVSLAEAGGYIRVFVDEGRVLRGLLASLAMTLRNEEPAVLDLLGKNLQGAALLPEESLARFKAYLSRLQTAFRDSTRRADPEWTNPSRSGKPGDDPTGRTRPMRSMVEPLSRREMEVLTLLAEGHSDKNIAAALVIARETVHKHLKNIYEKLDVHSRTEAVARAREFGLL